MADRCEDLDLESQTSDTSPLLMDQQASVPQEHVVTIGPDTDSASVDSGTLFRSSSSPSVPQEGASTGETLSRSQSANSSLRGQPSFPSGASTPSARSANSHGRSARQRTSPLNSGLWITIELTITISQIIASIIVLSVSRDEHPEAPLEAWVIGYAAGCVATLPLLYWRYTHRYVRSREQNAVPQAASSPATPSSASGATSYRSLTPSTAQEMTQSGRHQGFNGHESLYDDRIGVLVERFKIALDCFFAIWFVVGNVWIFGGHTSSSEAPNLYRLCIVFLTFSCIGYAMPFILCATICCCLPCIIALLGFREDPNQTRGASADVISALPTYKFKAKGSKKTKGSKDGDESDSESGGEGGLVAPGTEKERQVSAEDAVCCICLGKYTDGAELRELPCTHHFHVECVDKWLKINASCPLCKHEVGGAANAGSGNAGEAVSGSSEGQEGAAVGAGGAS
ncbi:hypothetical protein KC19_4G126000 [Ceratodon purpureus]|uniref:RING-type domain-containing protein n=1 Tax=Ceratodon purpureus TaxID=3225 RepID=A0A8T0IAK5_CERPU|nr:hypothetical protein KC19_4G126000 [Ceratodon purpureus]